MSVTNTNPVLGVVVLMRHGDRQGFYQNPTSYAASHTTITPLGEQQAYDTGAVVKARYLNTSSPSNIPSLSSVTSSGVFSGTAMTVRADNGGEGGVILDSVTAAFQGMFLPSQASNTTLANGQVVVSPLGGYQYVAVDAVNPSTNVSLEPWTDCPAFDDHVDAVYASDEFKQVGQENAAFFQSLVPLANGRNVTMSNFYNAFDYFNVESIHNATVAAQISNATMAHIRDIANFHEQSVFSDSSSSGIGNIAGRTILPQVISALTSFTNTSVPSRMTYIGVSYKPFLSIANMTQIESQAYGLVNYAAALTFEVRQAASSSESGSGSGSGYVVRASFKNGTDDADFRPLTLFGSGDVDYPLDQFVGNLESSLIPSLPEWCSACRNTATRGCDVVYEASRGSGGGPGTTYGRHDVSPLAAGFIGAAASLAVAAAALGVAARVGLVGFGRRRLKRGGDPGPRVGDSGSSSHSLTREKH